MKCAVQIALQQRAASVVLHCKQMAGLDSLRGATMACWTSTNPTLGHTLFKARDGERGMEMMICHILLNTNIQIQRGQYSMRKEQCNNQCSVILSQPPIKKNLVYLLW